MGISTDAVLIVGRVGSDLDEELLDLVDEGKLELASPWYDADREDSYVGVVVAISYGAEPIDLTKLMDEVDKAKTKFFNLTGLEGKLFVTPDVT